MVMLMLSPRWLSLLGSFELAANEAVFTTAVGLQRQTDIRPELALVRKRCGVWIKATKSAARMGPIEGIWRSNFTANVPGFSKEFSPRLLTQSC